ncbi:MAG: response regulator [Blastochloris sp.]|nr:response regulator [Blastochloris sp.]
MTCILVIDDQPHTASYIGGLVDPNWVVLSVNDGIAGIELVRQNPQIDLVLLDIQMPELDGYATATQIRSFNRRVRIVPYTVVDPIHDDPHLPRYMCELGCAAVLPKGTNPVLIQERLVAALAEVPHMQESAVLTQVFRVTGAHYLQCVRAQRARQGAVLVYTSAITVQYGLKHLLETIGQAPYVTVVPDLDQLADYMGEAVAHILVTTTHVYPIVRGRVTTTTALCPIILALSVHEALPIATQLTHHSPFPCWSVLVDDLTLADKMTQALSALRQGHAPWVDELIMQTHDVHAQRIREQMRALFGPDLKLTDREVQLIQLHLQQNQLTTKNIAKQLGTSEDNAYQIGSRLLKKTTASSMRALLEDLML